MYTFYVQSVVVVVHRKWTEGGGLKRELLVRVSSRERLHTYDLRRLEVVVGLRIPGKMGETRGVRDTRGSPVYFPRNEKVRSS